MFLWSYWILVLSCFQSSNYSWCASIDLANLCAVIAAVHRNHLLCLILKRWSVSSVIRNYQPSLHPFNHHEWVAIGSASTMMNTPQPYPIVWLLLSLDSKKKKQHQILANINNYNHRLLTMVGTIITPKQSWIVKQLSTMCNFQQYKPLSTTYLAVIKQITKQH